MSSLETLLKVTVSIKLYESIYMDILQRTTHLSYRKKPLSSMVAYKSLVTVSRTYNVHSFSDTITIFGYEYSL